MRQASFALALGAATVLGFAPFGVFALPWVTLALLFRLWQRVATPRGAAWLGFCWGLGFFLAGVSWVYVSLHDVGGMAAPLAAAATVLFCAYLALFPALVGYVFCRLRCARRLPSSAGEAGEGRAHDRCRRASADFWRDASLLAGLWTLAEWLRGALLTGFPWLSLGYAQTPPSPLAGYAAALGVYGVGFLAALISAALALDWRRKGTWALLIIALAAGQLLRAMDWTRPVGAPFTVSLLQGNIPQSLKWRPENLGLSLNAYLDLAQRHPAALTVLPETSIPLFFDEMPQEALNALTQHGDLLLGIAIRHRDGGYVNGAVAIASQADERRLQTYAKRHLVPFGEYVPPGFEWFFRLVDIPLSDFSAGPRRQPPLELAGQKVAPNICYEDLFGSEILAALPEATLLVNLSNTAWFGDSLAQPQHLQIARMRALETGRMMLRATNTGITAAIAPDGRVLGALPAFTRGALVIEAQGFAGLTPYMRWGDALALTLAIGALVPTAMRLFMRRSR
jgi:apolipoprotein N-acyltransferase